MIIGAQGYTIRNFVRNEEEIKNSIKKLKEIGYNCLQVSAFGPRRPAYTEGNMRAERSGNNCNAR